MSAAASAAEMIKQYGAQALGWARTFSSLAPSTSRRYWDTVHALILRKMSDPKANPQQRPMTYSAAHAWERQAAERGVSKVARSARGFMRAYEDAGTFANLSDWWKRRRAGFIARHMAQAGRGERLWERVRGQWRPTRRGLALIMWAMLPAGRPAGARPGH